MHIDSSRTRERRGDLVISATVLLVVAVGGLWVAGHSFGVGPLKCVGWEFDHDNWLTADSNSAEDLDYRKEEASQIADCGDLSGKTRAEVHSDLGTPDLPKERGQRNDQWHYYVGLVNDALGPGDAGYLFIRFDDEGKVALVQAP